MNETHTLPSATHRASWQGQLAGLRNLVATWRERLRLRRELEEKLLAAPHLIDDMGLNRQQAEAEIAKPFWQE